jgi:hypothetical protein
MRTRIKLYRKDKLVDHYGPYDLVSISKDGFVTENNAGHYDYRPNDTFTYEEIKNS